MAILHLDQTNLKLSTVVCLYRSNPCSQSFSISTDPMSSSQLLSVSTNPTVSLCCFLSRQLQLRCCAPSHFPSWPVQPELSVAFCLDRSNPSSQSLSASTDPTPAPKLLSNYCLDRLNTDSTPAHHQFLPVPRPTQLQLPSTCQTKSTLAPRLYHNHYDSLKLVCRSWGGVFSMVVGTFLPGLFMISKPTF